MCVTDLEERLTRASEPVTPAKGTSKHRSVPIECYSDGRWQIAASTFYYWNQLHKHLVEISSNDAH